MRILNKRSVSGNYAYLFFAVLSAGTAFGDRFKPKSNCSDLRLTDLTGKARRCRSSKLINEIALAATGICIVMWDRKNSAH
jgi:hypothetical protein